nr:UPF0481 protein At3g47200-like [Ipomoea trifida]
MAFEQNSTNHNYLVVTAYVKFLDFLIDSPGDVEVLTKYGVIDNWLGDSREVHRMFKKINSFITIHTTVAYPFAQLYDQVNDYCSKSVGGKIARMRRSLFRGSLALVWLARRSVYVASLCPSCYHNANCIHCRPQRKMIEGGDTFTLAQPTPTG